MEEDRLVIERRVQTALCKIRYVYGFLRPRLLYNSVARFKIGLFSPQCIPNLCPTKRNLQGFRGISNKPVAAWWVLLWKSSSSQWNMIRSNALALLVGHHPHVTVPMDPCDILGGTARQTKVHHAPDTPVAVRGCVVKKRNYNPQPIELASLGKRWPKKTTHGLDKTDWVMIPTAMSCRLLPKWPVDLKFEYISLGWQALNPYDHHSRLSEHCCVFKKLAAFASLDFREAFVGRFPLWNWMLRNGATEKYVQILKMQYRPLLLHHTASRSMSQEINGYFGFLRHQQPA